MKEPTDQYTQTQTKYTKKLISSAFCGCRIHWRVGGKPEVARAVIAIRLDLCARKAEFLCVEFCAQTEFN